MTTGPFAEVLAASIEHARIGQTRTCPDCGRPQHYSGVELGWCHDAAVDTWHCADPRKAGAWHRHDGDDAGWEITGPDGTNRLMTDKSVTLFGRVHADVMVAAYGLPPLPDETGA